MMFDELVKRLREVEEMLKVAQFKEAANLIEQAADAIEKLSKPRWIPVTEKLPQAYKPVLLYNGEGIATGYMHSDKRFTVNGSYFPSRPTHWMPLPEPPKEEMRNKDRIRPFCERLAVAWEKCPDMRFGQFICNVYATEMKRDPFYIEDDESMRLIEKCANECSPYHKPPEEERA